MRALPIAGIATLAFIGGVLLSADPGASERQLVAQYVHKWTQHQVPQMYGLLDAASRRAVSEPQFAAALERTAATATLTSLRAIRVFSLAGNRVAVRMLVTTRIWGTLRETLVVPLTGTGSSARVQLSREILFPGLRPGERLRRTVTLPPRGTLLANDGQPLAQGPGRTSPIPDVAGQIVGTVGPVPSTEAAQYAAQGYPPGALVGVDGLEHIFESQLVGTRGGGYSPVTGRSPSPPPCRRPRSRPRYHPYSSAPRSPRWAATTPESWS